MKRYKITPNITCLTANGYEAKLDVYQFQTAAPNATLIYIHGGGWAGGPFKEQYAHWFLPFLHMGWNVVNVEYRSSTIALAPAAGSTKTPSITISTPRASSPRVTPPAAI